MPEQRRWEERISQVARDLEELDQQLAEGEIGEDTGHRLREVYRAEMREARRWAAPAPPDDQPTEADGRTRFPSDRFWTPGRITVVAILGGAAAALAISVGWFIQTEDSPAPDDFDPSRYSNETMEAVIAANTDHPQINGMRLALAGRYFGEGAFGEAFSHYRVVLEHNPTAAQEAEALGRLGWMAWAGSGETQLALQTLERALQVAPQHPQNLYFKAMVLWCGAGRSQEAVPLLEEVMRALPEEAEVATELASARAEEECR